MELVDGIIQKTISNNFSTLSSTNLDTTADWRRGGEKRGTTPGFNLIAIGFNLAGSFDNTPEVLSDFLFEIGYFLSDALKRCEDVNASRLCCSD
jgi:hypothetical protein